MWKNWYADVIVIAIGVILVLFNASLVWIAIFVAVAGFIGVNIDGAMTDIRVDELEKRIKDLENK